MNKIFLSGNLTKDSELIKGENFNLVKFTIANNQYIGKDKQKTLFIECVKFYNKDYDISNVVNNLKKGTKVIIEGELEENNYETEQGEKRKKYSINVRNIEFFTFNKEKKEGNETSKQEENTSKNKKKKQETTNETDEEIPF